MNEIHFDETQLGNIQALGVSLFAEDASDPRSWNYERKLIRPKIRWIRILLFTVLLVFGTWGIRGLLAALGVPAGTAIWIALGGATLAVVLCLKHIAICAVEFYQRFAPESVRIKCRFEPSCSQYMILSLQKYGFWKGIRKGIHRLRRCYNKEGGFDYP